MTLPVGWDAIQYKYLYFIMAGPNTTLTILDQEDFDLFLGLDPKPRKNSSYQLIYDTRRPQLNLRISETSKSPKEHWP